jgi:hypothetical protein
MCTTECSNVYHMVPFNLSRNLNHKLYIDFDLNNRRVRWVLHCQCCNNPGIRFIAPGFDFFGGTTIARPVVGIVGRSRCYY